MSTESIWNPAKFASSIDPSSRWNNYRGGKTRGPNEGNAALILRRRGTLIEHILERNTKVFCNLLISFFLKDYKNLRVIIYKNIFLITKKR